MTHLQTTTNPKNEGLITDIKIRRALQKKLAAHSRSVLEAEYGLSLNTIISIEKHETAKPRSPEKTIREIRARRATWAIASNEMQNYTLQAIAKKWGVCTNTVVNHAKKALLNRSPA